jgi:hypothetical protein
MKSTDLVLVLVLVAFAFAFNTAFDQGIQNAASTWPANSIAPASVLNIIPSPIEFIMEFLVGVIFFSLFAHNSESA